MIKENQESNLKISYLLLIIMPLYNSILYVFQSVGLNVPLRMVHIYVLLLVYLLVILVKNKLPLKNLLCYFAILVFYGIGYLLSSQEAKQFFDSTDVMANLFVISPIACMCTAKVNNWEPMFEEKRYYVLTDVVITLSFLSKLNLLSEIDYMSYSYGLLPLWAMCLVSAYVFKKKSQWIFLLLGVIEGLVYGARAPLIWMILLAFISWMVLSREVLKQRRFSRIIPSLAFFGGMIVIVQQVIPLLIQSSLSKNSYVLRRFRVSSLLESGSRERIYIECRRIISEMGFSVYGLFYDRTVLPNGVYSHNIIYEVLISLGWFFGFCFLAAVLYLIIRTIMKQNPMGIIFVAFFASALFFRYFLSGSIFDETKFVLFMTALYSLQASSSNTLKSRCSKLAVNPEVSSNG